MTPGVYVEIGIVIGIVSAVGIVAAFAAGYYDVGGRIVRAITSGNEDQDG